MEGNAKEGKGCVVGEIVAEMGVHWGGMVGVTFQFVNSMFILLGSKLSK